MFWSMEGYSQPYAFTRLPNSCTLTGVDISNCCIQSMVSAQNTAIVLKLIACGAGVNTFNPEAPDGRGYMIQSAVSAGNVELSTELLQMGADIAVKDSNGDCLLHMACRIGIAQVRRCMVELIARRAPWQISAKNNLGQGPVEQAMGRKGIAKMVKRILAESEREASDAATKDTREIFCEENIIPNGKYLMSCWIQIDTACLPARIY